MQDEQVTEETLDTQEVEEVVEVEEQDEPVDDIKAKLAKAEELANNYKIRAEKAEAKAKEAPKAQELSAVDILAVSKANIEPEDLGDVVDYAKYKGISIAEALRSPVVKATLAEKEELRKSAAAVNTGAVRRTSSKVSDDQLLANARKGIMPDSDEDLARLVKLRRS